MDSERYDDPRRQFLIRALAAGLYTAGGGISGRALADFFGKTPEKLGPEQSIYRVEGDVRVNGQPAGETTHITANDTLQTGANSKAIFVVGQDAFLLRENSRLELSGKAKFQQRLQRLGNSKPTEEPHVTPPPSGPPSGVVESFRLMTGGVLTVFGKTRHTAETSTAMIGIQGTGVYFESEPDRSYVCTCYGTTAISSLASPADVETVNSRHHDAPKYILADDAADSRIVQAPFKNHNDLELMLLEELVGRTPPFAISGEHYGSPRRGY